MPLFSAPGPKRKKDAPPVDERPISRDRVEKWLVRAEELAELPKLVGGRFHPYPRLCATERKGLPLKDVAEAGGWRDAQTLQRSYQRADAAGIAAVVPFDG